MFRTKDAFVCTYLCNKCANPVFVNAYNKHLSIKCLIGCNTYSATFFPATYYGGQHMIISIIEETVNIYNIIEFSDIALLQAASDININPDNVVAKIQQMLNLTDI